MWTTDRVREVMTGHLPERLRLEAVEKFDAWLANEWDDGYRVGVAHQGDGWNSLVEHGVIEPATSKTPAIRGVVPKGNPYRRAQ